METLEQLISFLQIILIPGGAVARILYCLGVMGVDSDEEKSYRVRIRNILIFVVLAETLTGLLRIVLNYF